MGNFGMWTLVPALIVVVAALASKRIVESLLLGFLSAYGIIAISTHQGFLELAMGSFYTVVTDRNNVWVIAVVFLLGSLGALLTASKGTKAITEFIDRRCKKEKSINILTWLLSVLLFIDSYLNIITVSSSMKKTYDKKKIPRETVASVIEMTGMSACVMIPFSSSALFYATSFYAQDSVSSLGFGSAMETYYHIIPYIFYAQCSLIIVLLLSAKIIPAWGPLKQAYADYRERTDDTEETGADKGHMIDFFAPIVVLIVAAIIINDIMVALIITIICCFVLYVPRKIITAGKFCDLWLSGMQSMLPAVMVMLFAFLMKQACMDINLPVYAVENTRSIITAETFPAIAFILVGLLSFLTGNGWSGPALCIPVIIPMAAACGANMIYTMAAIVSGGVLCGHVCFYSDLVLLTSASCEINSMKLVKTLLPYASIAFGITVVMYFAMGYLVS